SGSDGSRFSPPLVMRAAPRAQCAVAAGHDMITTPNSHLVGKPGSRKELATPSLVLDLPAFERNLAAMQEHCNRVGLQLRPHAKTHKCATIAKRQVKAGAVGICVAKLGEAEALADAGVESVLITSPIVTPQGFNRLAALNARLKELIVVADSDVSA